MTDEITHDEPATGEPMQDIVGKLEAKLFGAEEKPEELNEDEAPVDESEETLPEGDDSESEEDEGEEGLADIADGEELSLADYLGVDDDRIEVGDDGSVTLNTIVDGEQKHVPLPELVASYQMQGHVNNKSIALEDERKEFEEQRSSVAGELQKRVESIDALSKVVEQQLVKDFNTIDWDRLRTENPSEWTALRQEYSEKAQEVQRVQQTVASAKAERDEEGQRQMQSQMATHLQGQYEEVLKANPTWIDDTVRAEAQTGMRSFLTTAYGFGEDDMKTVSDHRLIAMIQDAKAYREGKKSAEIKKGKAVPKFRKPGASKKQTASAANARNVKAKRKAVRDGGGKPQDIANLILDRM